MTVTIIVLYLMLVLGLGIWAGRAVHSLRDFALAGKSFGPLVIFATLSASFIGGGFSMGNAEKVFLVGLSNIVALWGFSLKELMVARYVAPRMVHYPDAISVGDIMEPHYGRGARIFSGVFAIALCAGILGAQIGAMGYVFHVFMGFDRLWGVLIGCSIVIAYATIGGMRSVVWTDIMQFVVLVIGMPLTLYFGLQWAGGWESVMQAVPDTHWQLPTEPRTWVAIIALFLTFMLGETLVPPYLQRLLIGKDNRAVVRGTLYSGLFSIPFFALTGVIGLLALAMEPTLNPNLAMPFVIEQAVPAVLAGIVVAAIISIVMSSADSFLNAASIALINDVIKPLRRSGATDRQELWWARLATLGVGLGAVAFALTIDSVLDILIYAYQFWAPTVLVPLLMAILGFAVSRKRFIAGSVAGIATALLWGTVLDSPFLIDGLILGTAANFLVFTSVDRNLARRHVSD